jgi:ketosteroid isomerase-like protein
LEVAADDLECVMVAPEYAGPRGRLTYSGPEGFVQAWREWVAAYERYTIELEEITEGDPGQVFILARQRGTTRTGGVEVSEPAGAVWTVRDGKLVRMEFHLDPETARRAAGLA